MSALDSLFAQPVLDLIARIGISATIFEVTGPSYDPATGTQTQNGFTRNVTISPLLRYNRKYVDGVNVLDTDYKTYIAGSGLSFVPRPGWRITVAGEAKLIISVKDLKTGDAVAAYELQCR